MTVVRAPESLPSLAQSVPPVLLIADVVGRCAAPSGDARRLGWRVAIVDAAALTSAVYSRVAGHVVLALTAFDRRHAERKVRTVLGRCEDLDVVERLARVREAGRSPLLERVLIERSEPPP
jgi:hypothetical protein